MSTSGSRGETVRVALDDRWGSPATFGGALAAALVRSDTAAGASGWVPTEVHASFHRVVPPGELDARHEVLRDGRRRRTTLIRGFLDSRPTTTVMVGWTRADELDVVPASVPRGLPPTGPADPRSLSGELDWRCARPWPARSGGTLESWIRPLSDEWGDPTSSALHPAWYLVAGDVLAPAIVNPGESLRIATVTLQLTVARLSAPGWIGQSLRAERLGDRATSILELRTARGVLLASLQQSALLAPAEPGDMPVSATAFGWGGPVPVT